MSIKHELEKSLPESLHFTSAEKEAVFERIHKRKKRRFQVLPALAGVMVLIMIAVLIVPELTSNRTAQDVTIEKLVVPDTPYPSLINAIYVDETSELIFSEETGLYSYSESSGKEQLVSLPGIPYNVAATEDWLVWSEPVEGGAVLNVMNRSNQQVITVEGRGFANLSIEEDTLVYLNGGEGVYVMDLNNQESEFLHKSTGGSRSESALQGNQVVIPEENDGVTKLFIYDIQTMERVNEIELPFEIVEYVQWSGEFIYSQGRNVDEMPVLLQANSQTGEVQEIQTPEFDEFAAYGDRIALRVPEGESNTVMLYEVDELKVRPLNTLDHIEERLTKPRFTEEGTLVLNSEGPDFAMYILEP
ncbi:hypothetical protein KP77_09900 [Jeotgalibacillus alimentarius]|uniref:DUF5050 domain-containing protein n=1 Tax=Jeotgalibacillus alimentarius TaxID=135826 RepID=A0A0C2W618_9BACL|nr:hypothetical protein [Jeotgalibacillus alimentarius]KIL51478.1 hypothetical protein KP77_09900 [Jeotgalibacillus alimentarius]